MKRILLILGLLLLSNFGRAQTTPNIGLNIPPFGAPNWNVQMNQNFSALDFFLSGNSAIPALKITGVLTLNSVTGLTQCMQVNSSGQFQGAAIPCGPTLFAGNPTGGCSSSNTAVDTTTGNLYSCNAGSWLKIGPNSAAGNPGGGVNQLQYNVAGTSFGGFTLSGDCTLVVSTGVITCTKTNGVAYAPSATSDTTNAANITSGLMIVPRGGSGAGTLSGILKGNGTAAFTPATSADVISLWITGVCNSSTFLRGDGGCFTPAGGGNVSTGGGTSPQVAYFSGSTAISGTATDSTVTHVLHATNPPAFGAIVSGDLPVLSTTVNFQTCTIGSTCTIPFQTNTVGNTSQAGINLLTSTVNSVGLTVTPTNSGTNQEKFEITGGAYSGTAANLSGSPALPNGTTATTQTVGDNTTKLATDAFVIANAGTGSGTVGTGTPDGVAYYTGTTTTGSTTPPTANGLYQLIENVTGGVAVPPAHALGGVPTNAQVGTTYTYLYSDRASYVTFSNAASIAVSLPAAGSTGFTANWVNVSCDIGAGTVTITPTTSTISISTGAAYTAAASTMTLTTGQCAYIYSDNTNYFAFRPGGGGSGVTSVSGTANQIDVATGTTTPVISLDSALAFPGTISSAQAGASSASAATFTGTPFSGTGTTSTPLFYFNGGTAPTTWSTAGTYFGANAVTGFTGNFLDYHLNGGASLFKVAGANGAITTGASVTVGNISAVQWTARTSLTSPSDGILNLENNAGTSFTRLQFGGTTSSFAGLCSSTTVLNMCLADGTAGGLLTGSFAVGSTAHGVVVSEGATTAAVATAAGTTNQVLASAGASTDPGYKSWADLDSTQYIAATGIAQAQVVTLAPAATALVNGLEVNFLPVAANTAAAPTMALNGLTAKPITKLGTTALVANDLTTTAIASVIYDGTEWQLQNPQTTSAGTVTVVGAGSLTSTALVTGGGSQTLQTPSATATLSAGGNLAIPGTIAVGSSPPTCAAASQFALCGTEGTAPTGASNVGDIWPNSADHNWYIQSNAGVIQHFPQILVVQGTAYTNATTTFSTVAGGSGPAMSWTVAASTPYAGHCFLIYSASVATAGPKIQFTGPASPTLINYSAQFMLTSGATPTYAEAAAATAFSTSLSAGTAVTATTNQMVRIDFTLVNGTTAGTLTLQAASQGVGTLTLTSANCVMQ